MSETGEYPLLGGSRQVLMLSTVVMAVVAVAVLALGIQDPRLLRLGLVAALWAALLGAFATARVRRETSSWAEQADQLRTLYQRELECEAAARHENALTVERELREQAQRSQRREIVELRTELTALRASLEQLLGGKPQLGAESANLFPQFRFGPSRPQPSSWGSAAFPTGPGISNRGMANRGVSNEQGRHGTPGREWSGPNEASSSTTTTQAKLTVSDLLAAHGTASPPNRSHDERPATLGEGVFRHSVGGVAW